MTDNRLTIRLFGDLGAWIGGDRILGLHRREGERLLAYLALHAGEPVSYRTLAELFWPSEAVPGSGDFGTFQSTRQAVHYLRVALSEHSERLQSIGRGKILFDLKDANVDVLEFDRLVRLNDAASLRRAREIHTAPLLESWNEAWAADARSVRLRSVARITQILEATGALQDPPTAERVIKAGDRGAPAFDALQEPLGGAVSLNSPFYVVREADSRFIDAIGTGTSTVLVKADARMGKSSLLARGLDQARKYGAMIALTDFKTISGAQFESSDSLFSAMAASLALQLDVEFDPGRHWSTHFGPGTNLEQFLRKHIFAIGDQPLIWFMDDVDLLFKYPYCGELFGLLRSWHNRRAMDPTGPWARLTLVLAYSAETALFIADENQSPFNIGIQVTLSDFTLEEQADLNVRYGLPLKSPFDQQRLYAHLQGHPFLTRRALQELATGTYDLDRLLERAEFDDGPFGEDLRKLTSGLVADKELAASMRSLVQGDRCGDRLSFYRLRSGGFVKGEWNINEQVRCPLYASYLRRILQTQSAFFGNSTTARSRLEIL